MTQKTALVIGAGVGGLATAIHLARKNYSVTILEKTSKAGGRCNQLTKDGHVFDIGPTFYIFPELYEQMFASLGENVHNYLHLERVDPTHKVFFQDATSLKISSDLTLMQSQLEAIESGSYSQFLNYIHQVQKFYQPTLNKIINSDFPHFWNYFTLDKLHLLIKSKGWQNHYQYLGKFFQDYRLKDAFTFQDSYIGLNPHQTLSMFSIFSISELTKGVWLPKGGMYQIVESLLKIASKYDIKINYKVPVKEIKVKLNKVHEVISEQEQVFKADVVIANTDYAYTFNTLLPPSKEAESLNKKKFSCSTITYFWGLKKQYPELLTHNIFLAKDNFRGYNDVVNLHKVPDEPHFYVHAPARTDHHLAPEGQDTFTVIVPVGHLTQKSTQDWSELKQKTRKYVLQRFMDIGLVDFEKNIKFEMSATPTDWLDEYNLTNGSTLGFHHNMLQMGYLRPSRKHPRIKNLYFVGSNTHPGSGVPTVLLSAEFTAKAILSAK